MVSKPTKKQQTHFPGSPLCGLQERIIRQDVGAVSHGGILSTRLLNCLIQRAAPQPAAMCSDKVLLGSLTVRSYMKFCNGLFGETTGATSSNKANKEKKIAKIRSRFEHVINLHNDCVNRLIIPVVEDLHFFVFVVDFSQACPDFFINFHYYNSLRRSTRAGVRLPSDSSEIVAEVNEFLCNFVLHKTEHEHLQRAHHEVFDKLQYQECPEQISGIGVVLHILVGETIDRDTFSQEYFPELRLKLGDQFMGARHNRTNKTNHQTTSKVV
jgi:hypothetical protein